MTKGYARIAAATPSVAPGAVEENLSSAISLFRQAAEAGADAVVFPELCLTGYTCADLFFRPALLESAEDALSRFVAETASHPGTLAAVGLPVSAGGRIFNCAAVCMAGRLAGVVPKTFLPGTHEFYEPRWFASADDAAQSSVSLAGFEAPFGKGLVFKTSAASFGVEICEDMWAVRPPSEALAVSGATVMLNPSASNELAGKTAYRRSLVAGLSARCICAYAYSGAGAGESTTDLVFGGHSMIAENGEMLAEGERFSRKEHLILADVDTEFLDFERTGNNAFRKAAAEAGDPRTIDLSAPAGRPRREGLLRRVDPHPFVPGCGAERSERCAEVLAIQANGLATRLLAIGCRDVVVGLSGGLDSALALIVCVEAFRIAGFDPTGIHVFTLPGFGTSGRTKSNAGKLCKGLGLDMETVDISPSARLHLSDLGRDESVKDVTYENAQARGRTYFLMDKANQTGAILVGTGDLSELALGWCTYNGDHMSMYGVNAGVPKTLVRHVVGWYAENHPATKEALEDILATPVSPELLPAAADGSIAQETEDKVGPYELHDFFLYHFVRRGARREKILSLALAAFGRAYSRETMEKWLDVFFRRFATQQFKRSCMPDGPKVGSINLSPRGDWRMPSDTARLV